MATEGEKGLEQDYCAGELSLRKIMKSPADAG